MNNSMTASEAITFIREHQPMPNLIEGEFDDDLLLQWITSLNILSDYPHLENVSLILNSYGGGFIPDGIDDIFCRYDPSTLIPQILIALGSQNADTREFAIFNLVNVINQEIFGYHNSIFEKYKSCVKQLVNSLLSCLIDDRPEVRDFAIGILHTLEKYDNYDSNTDKEYIRDCYLKEKHKFPKSTYEDDVLNAIEDLVPKRKRTKRL